MCKTKRLHWYKWMAAGICLPVYLLINVMFVQPALAQESVQEAKTEELSVTSDIQEIKADAVDVSNAVSEQKSDPAPIKSEPVTITPPVVTAPKAQAPSPIFQSNTSSNPQKKERKPRKKLSPKEKKMQDFETVWRKKRNAAKTPQERKEIFEDYYKEKAKFEAELQLMPDASK